MKKCDMRLLRALSLNIKKWLATLHTRGRINLYLDLDILSRVDKLIEIHHAVVYLNKTDVQAMAATKLEGV